ncbi:MAG TPA: bacteriohemerythrin [Bacteroidota bacterium]|nr:bacteriohemerythrin [Bacteroidota bacterium]
MLNYEWKPEYLLGNEQIDAHHKRIIGLISKLYHAVKIGQDLAVLEEILESLEKYASTHFAAEEKLFLPTGYPDSAKHIALHREFCTKLEQLNILVHNNDTLAGLELMEFLTHWFVNHILQIDMTIMPYLPQAQSFPFSASETLDQ